MHLYKIWHTLKSGRLASTPRSFLYSLTFVAVFFGIYGYYLLNMHASPPNPLPTDIALVMAAFTSFVLSWIGVKHSHGEHNTTSGHLPLERRLSFWVPLAFSITLLFQGIGNGINLYHDLFVSLSNPPIWVFIAILGTYPAMLAGIFLLPRDTLSGKIPLRFIMNSLMLITAIVTFSWYFLIGPMLFNSQGMPIFMTAMSAAYAIFDLVIISCFILLSYSITNPSLRNIIRGLSLAMIIFVLTDSMMLFQNLHGLFDSTWLSSLGWIGGNFAIALSLQAMRWQRVSVTSEPTSSSLVATPLWQSLLSYALVPAVIVLVLSLLKTGNNTFLAIGTYFCSLLLLGLIFAKQFMVIQEVHGLNRGFQHLQHVISEKNTELHQANTRLETLATTDPLTELPNHRALISVLDQELARSQQYQRSCSLLFFDLDHFKALNDGYGHAIGDIALRDFSSLLRTTLSPINTIGRWGGEEFVAILPEQDATKAADIAEELRQTVANHLFSVGGGMHLTCSIGVASSPAHALHQEELLQAADSAMYAAKRLGRNQFRLIDDPTVIALLATHAEVEGRDNIALIGTAHALTLLVEKRDIYIGTHAQRTGELLLPLARSLDLSESEAQLLSLAGQLHDIGKIVVPDNILQKQEPLTGQELTCIHQHPQVGAEVVHSIPSLRTLAPIIYSHHEWWNGMGYPQQQAGETIPLGARMLAIVDAYVMMTHAHPQPDDSEHIHALAELQRGAGTQFDPTIVAQFISLQAPIQTTSGELAIV